LTIVATGRKLRAITDAQHLLGIIAFMLMSENRKSLHVLVAEDNPINQKLAVRLLQKQGHTSVVANNGREAIELWETQSFDAILMDMMMPEMDGVAATLAIREREKVSGQHIPIIAITANAMVGDREKCLAAGMDDYISKPVNVTMLYESLAKLTGQ
jgi:two-component system, sensor histidine kinase and response regulator